MKRLRLSWWWECLRGPVFGLWIFGALAVGQAHAQATFSLATAPTTVTRSGHTELMGPVAFVVQSGITVEGRIIVSVPVALTNTNESDGITLDASPGLAGASIAGVSGATGDVVIDVPAGGTATDVISLTGLRFSPAETGVDAVVASISINGNRLLTGQNDPTLVREVADGFLLGEDSDFTFGYRNNVLVDAFEGIVLFEGHEAAFTSSLTLGQTTPTMIRFLITGIPDNVSVTFPDVMTSPSSGAALTTLSGNDEVRTRAVSGPVTYEFGGFPSSNAVIDLFELDLAITRTDPEMPAATGTATVQVGLYPTGVAVPDEEFPEDRVPRYQEQFLPEIEAAPAPPLLTLLVPESADDFSLFLSNTSSGGAQLTFNALGEDGSLLEEGDELASTASFNMDPGQSRTFTLDALFGSQATPLLVAAVSVESENDQVVGVGVAEFPNGTIIVDDSLPKGSTFRIPLDRASGADSPSLILKNDGFEMADVRIEVADALGASQAVSMRTLEPGVVLREALDVLFDTVPGSLPLNGYLSVTATSGAGLQAWLTPGATGPATAGVGTPIASIPRILGPFFAFGRGYNTILSVVNGAVSAEGLMTLTLFSTDGTPLAEPFERIVAAGERTDFDFESLFGAGPELEVGYFRLESRKTSANPFTSAPRITASTRVNFGNAAASSPPPVRSDTEFFLVPPLSNNEAFTGIVVLNDTAEDTSVTVEAFEANGRARGESTFELAAGESRLRLLRELAPESLGRAPGYVRITSTPSKVIVVGYRGTLTLTELLYLGPQTTP